MKKLLILALSLFSVIGYSQTQINPALSPTTSRINAAIKGSLTATGTNTYATTLSGFTIASGEAIDITFTNANSGASTFNLNGTGAITLKKFSSGSLVDLASGDISAGERKRFYHNGTYLVIEGGTGSGGGGGGDLLAANNLSDLANVSTARTNLGLGTAALISSTAGGDLSGTLPSPTVAKINGNTIPANAAGSLTNNGSGTLTWTPAGTGSVTSVGLSLPSIFSVSGSPVTGTGTLTGTLATQTNGQHFLGPLPNGFGNTGTPTFRDLANTDLFQRNRYKLPIVGTPLMFGDSFTQSQQATSAAYGFVKQLEAIYGFTFNNQGVGARGMLVSAIASYANQATFNGTNSVFIISGFNDLRRNGSASSTLTKIAGCNRAILVNTWLKFATPASAVTNTGTWSNYTNANGSLKAINLSGNARQSSTSGDLITYTTLTASDNIVVGTVNCDGTTANYGRFTVTIDGTVVDTFNPAGRTDAISDGATDNSVTPEVLIYKNLKNSTHIVTLTLLDSKTTVIDYIGFMREPQYCPPVFIATYPRMDATGYATSPANSNNTVMTTAKIDLKTLEATFPNRPLNIIDLDQYYDLSSGLGADHIHPNDAGYSMITNAFTSAVASAYQASGSALSGLTAATSTNSIDNGNNQQTWNWNTLTSSNFGLLLNSTATTSPAALLKITTSGTNASSAQTTYGAQIVNTHAGTTSTNVGLYLSTSGGTTANYPLMVDNNGTVVFGTTSPTLPTTDTKLQVIRTGAVTFDVAGSSSFARMLLRDLGQTTDHKNYELLNTSTKFTISRVNDAVNSRTTRFGIEDNGNISIGSLTATALLHVAAGTATANTAPMKFTSGTFLTTPEAGAMEYDGINLAFTPSGTTTRKIVSANQVSRSTAQTAAVASVVTWTVGANDGSFDVSSNVNLTAATTNSFTVTVTYTDETNTSRTTTFSFVQNGVPTPIQTITNVTGVGAYSGMPMSIRCKAATTITIATTGTFTSVTYNVEGRITQTN